MLNGATHIDNLKDLRRLLTRLHEMNLRYSRNDLDYDGLNGAIEYIYSLEAQVSIAKDLAESALLLQRGCNCIYDIQCSKCKAVIETLAKAEKFLGKPSEINILGRKIENATTPPSEEDWIGLHPKLEDLIEKVAARAIEKFWNTPLPTNIEVLDKAAVVKDTK